MSKERHQRIGRDKPRLPNRLDREDIKVREVRKDVDSDQRQRPENDRARKIALRIFHLARRKRQVGPAVVRPEHADQREADAPEHQRSDRRRREMSRGGAVAAANRERGEHQQRERRELRPRRHADDERPDVGAADVRRCRKRDGRRRQASRGQHVRGGIDPEAAQQVFAEDDRDAAEGRCADQNELGPAEQERRTASP